jgi:hypothetical protein
MNGATAFTICFCTVIVCMTLIGIVSQVIP